MKDDKDKQFIKWLNNFNSSAFVDYNGKKYRITSKELESIYSTGHYWHHKTDPSSWLSEAMVTMAKRKFKGKLPRDHVILLCSRLLNITPEKLEGNLEWNANYMAWHDGGAPEDHHAWNPGEKKT
jgi:hypothetical protein